jgi:hypothetical protein
MEEWFKQGLLTLWKQEKAANVKIDDKDALNVSVEEKILF